MQVRIHGAAVDQEFAARNRQLEAARSRTPGIHEQNAIAQARRRVVRVTVNDDAHLGGHRIDVDLREVMNRIDQDLFNAQEFGDGQTRCPRPSVIVAANRRDGGEITELGEQAGFAYIAGMHDRVAAREVGPCFGSQQAVGVRDEADAMQSAVP